MGSPWNCQPADARSTEPLPHERDVNWFRKARKRPGWMAVDVQAREIALVHGEAVSGTRPHLRQYAVQSMDAGTADRLARSIGVTQYACLSLLAPAEYQVIQVERPNVPAAELKTAVRWRVKDLLDHHVEDVTLDVLEVPPSDEVAARAPHMYAIAARNDVVQSRVRTCAAAGVGVTVIDIPETAQRNIAALYEEDDRAVAALHCNEQGGLLTINFRGELYFTRRIEVSFDDIGADDLDTRNNAHERIVVELQRSLDHFERQHRALSINRLLLGPEPLPTGLQDSLAGGLGLRMQAIDLNTVLAIDGTPLDDRLQWRLFHLVGASLRREVKAL